MSKLDIFVSEINKYSDNPINGLYEFNKNFYLKNNDVEKDTNIIYDEVLYFLLTDLEFGYEFHLKKYDLIDELETYKDIIAYDCSKNTKSDILKMCQKIKFSIENDEYPLPTKKKLNIFINSAMSLLDDRYIINLVENLINEDNLDVDFLFSIVNQRLKEKRKVILKL